MKDHEGCGHHHYAPGGHVDHGALNVVLLVAVMLLGVWGLNKEAARREAVKAAEDVGVVGSGP